MQDTNGEPITGYALDDCREVIGNEIERSVTWKGGDLSRLAGTAVRLRFQMKDADLFAMRFGEPTADSAVSELSPVSTPERQTLVNILTEALSRRDFVGIHAAEALIAIGNPQPVVEAFEPQLNSTEPKYRIGVLRVLARCETDPLMPR